MIEKYGKITYEVFSYNSLITTLLTGMIIGGIIHFSHFINLITYCCGSKYYIIGSILDTFAYCITMASAIPKTNSTSDNPNQDVMTTYYILVAALVIQFYAKGLGMNADYA